MATLGRILEGRPVADYHEEKIQRCLRQWGVTHGAPPALSLATVQFGETADLVLYAKALSKMLARFGVRHIKKQYSTKPAEQGEVLLDLYRVYRDSSITGVLIYSPVPSSVDARTIFLNMPLDQDIEGRTFMKRNPFGVFSPTAKAVMALLSHLERAEQGRFILKEKHAVMVGHSDLVGKPTMALLSDAGATVTLCHQFTNELPERVAEADILVVAIGKPRYVHGSWIKKGAVVLDVGENVVGGHVVGDVDFESALENASYVSPVPGGVGPLTNLMVIENLLMLHEYKVLHGNH